MLASSTVAITRRWDATVDSSARGKGVGVGVGVARCRVASLSASLWCRRCVGGGGGVAVGVGAGAASVSALVSVSAVEEPEVDTALSAVRVAEGARLQLTDQTVDWKTNGIK